MAIDFGLAFAKQVQVQPLRTRMLFYANLSTDISGGRLFSRNVGRP
jgi:hypothetical protein